MQRNTGGRRMRALTRLVAAIGGFVAGGLLLWGGYAFASHRAGTLHACVSGVSLRVSEDCRTGDRSVLLVTEPALASLEARVASLESARTALQERVGELESLLAGVTRRQVDGRDTLQFSGMNLQVVNGAGSTAERNGVGNLILGYNTPPPFTAPTTRVGSHYLVVGDGHDWMGHGGIVAGMRNKSLHGGGSVLGGVDNTAIGAWATVSGGEGNVAGGGLATVAGGSGNSAAGNHSSVSGGYRNIASGNWASVSGGDENRASGDWSAVSGGWANVALGSWSSVLGGDHNWAVSGRSSVSGGTGNRAEGTLSSVLGGFGTTVSGDGSCHPAC